jgi:glucose-1-phosphate thymidylyltransferase
MRGIVLAGGTGSRLWPLTQSTSKQLLPIYDKPMIYYPLSTLMLAGVSKILLISTARDLPSFKNLLGDGSNFGIEISYAIQEKPRGLAESLLIAKDFLEGENALLILGDNIFYGRGLGRQLRNSLPSSGCHIFTIPVATPSDYGVLTVDENGVAIRVEEKPKNSNSNLAITGLYFFDNLGPDLAQQVKASKRGELEITSVIEKYLKTNTLTYTIFTRGSVWLDTGSVENLNNASNFVRIIEERTGFNIGALEEIAYLNGWITTAELQNSIDSYPHSSYRNYLDGFLKENLRQKTIGAPIED